MKASEDNREDHVFSAALLSCSPGKGFLVATTTFELWRRESGDSEESFTVLATSDWVIIPASPSVAFFAGHFPLDLTKKNFFELCSIFNGSHESLSLQYFTGVLHRR